MSSLFQVDFALEGNLYTGEQDRFVWFCEGCGNKLYETTIAFDDPTDAVKLATERIRSDEKLRTCRNCGAVLAA